jgi:catecholate siderophore receptor
MLRRLALASRAAVPEPNASGKSSLAIMIIISNSDSKKQEESLNRAPFNHGKPERIAGSTLLAGAFAAAFLPGTAHAETDSQPQIIVNGQRETDVNPNADPDAPYKIDRSASDKFTEGVRDTPKSQYIIPKEVVEDIGATTFREVVRSTPGVTLGTGEGGNAFGDRIFIRGFEARNDIYIDGLRDPGVVSREIFAVEQIEIVKGPSGNFGGRGTTGGLVSLQSKAPSANDFVKVEGSLGTERFKRATVDANYLLSDSVSLRVNGLYHDQDIPGRDHVDSERYGITAALKVELAPDVTAIVDYYHFRLNGMSDFGFPFDSATGQPYAVDRNNFYGAVGRDFLDNGSDIGTLRLAWKAGDNLELRTITRYGKTSNRYVTSVPRAPRPADPVNNLRDAGFSAGELVVDTSSPQRNATSEYFANITDATWRFDTGGITHALVFGVEYAEETVTNRRYAFPELIENADGDRIDTPNGFTRSLIDPDPVLGFTIPAILDPDATPSVTEVESASVFAIDTIDLTPSLKATLGLRYDTFDIISSGSDRSGTFSRGANVDFVNYQASLLWKPVEAASLYASFATSSNPSGEQLDSTSSSYGGLGSGEELLEPERNTSYEIGAKYEAGNLLLQAAVFQIEKTNAREQIEPGVFALTGEQRVRGFELGVSGNITRRLAVFGGYTYLDTAITESLIDPENVGLPLANVPKNTASLLVNYALSSSLAVGLQTTYRDKIFGGSLVPNVGFLDDYVRFDAVARYNLSNAVQFRVNVLNLTDKTYFDAIYRSGSPFAYIAPGQSAYATVEVSF